MTVLRIEKSDPRYPASLREHLGDHAPGVIIAHGNLDILQGKKLALFCSIRCPGNLILKTYDLARELRDTGITAISGFHSPMEKECLDLLLRGNQPVILCPARRLSGARIPKEYADALGKGRLLILSSFGENVTRATAETARVRNEFVAALADRVFVAYASPASKTETFCRRLLAWGKPVLTFDGAEKPR